MAGNPLDIGTEEGRKSLNQSMVELYAKVPAGGAFNAKDITTDGTRASLQKAGNINFQSGQYTPAGYKTLMQRITEYNQKALSWAKDFYGHSTRKYKG